MDPVVAGSGEGDVLYGAVINCIEHSGHSAIVADLQVGVPEANHKYISLIVERTIECIRSVGDIPTEHFHRKKMSAMANFERNISDLSVYVDSTLATLLEHEPGFITNTKSIVDEMNAMTSIEMRRTIAEILDPANVTWGYECQ